jgi:hypothetical protein
MPLRIRYSARQSLPLGEGFFEWEALQNNDIRSRNSFMAYFRTTFRKEGYTICTDSFRIAKQDLVRIKNLSFVHRLEFEDGTSSPTSSVKQPVFNTHVSETVFAQVEIQFTPEWDGRLQILPMGYITYNDSPVFTDTLEISFEKDSLRFPKKVTKLYVNQGKIKWADVYSNQVMQTFDKPLIREKLKQWLLTIDERQPLPEHLHELNFNLWESPEGFYSISLVGLGEHPLECNHLKISIRNPREEVLTEIRKILKKISRELRHTRLMREKSILM